MKLTTETTAPVVKWLAPKAAAQVEWEDFLTEHRGLLPRLISITVILLAVSEYIHRRYAPHERFPVHFVALLCAVLLLKLYWEARLSITVRKPITISGKGIRSTNWKRFSGWTIVNHEKCYRLRVLELSVANKRYKLKYVFDPDEVQEADIRAALEHYLQGKEKHGSPRE